MTLQELYTKIDGDYSHAESIMPMESFIDRCIRMFADGGSGEALASAAKTKDPQQLFEASHALKGVSANLGLTKLSALASEITEEFRPGNARTMTDEEVEAKLKETEAFYNRTIEMIRQYEAENA